MPEPIIETEAEKAQWTKKCAEGTLRELCVQSRRDGFASQHHVGEIVADEADSQRGCVGEGGSDETREDPVASVLIQVGLWTRGADKRDEHGTEDEKARRFRDALMKPAGGVMRRNQEDQQC